jgi:clusterin-associated protein 1
MENFRTPNFELVADVLYWMVKLYDPDTTISDRVEFENERVEFLTGIASLLAAKARLKLNTKKLYASDGRAVQELLKLASLLHKATRSAHPGSRSKVTSTEDDTPPPQIKMQDVKDARKLASELTQSGAKLYDLLEAELSERPERNKALRFLDVAAAAPENSKDQQAVERKVRELIDNTRQAVEDAKKEAEELEADQRTLAAKITKRSEELERTEKRLKSLESVRPQFLEEAEKLEKELQRYYEVYVERQRNLSYLEGELDRFRIAEEETARETEARLKKMREKLLKEEVELMRGGPEGRSLADAAANNSNGGIFGGSSSKGGRVSGGIAEDDYRSNSNNSSKQNARNNPTNKGSQQQSHHNHRGGGRGSSRSDEEDDEDEDEEDDEEDLSVNERYQMHNNNRGGNNSAGHGHNHHSSSTQQQQRGKSGGSSSAGRGAIASADDFLDDDEDEEDDEDDDEDEGHRGDGNFSESDDF